MFCCFQPRIKISLTFIACSYQAQFPVKAKSTDWVKLRVMDQDNPEYNFQISSDPADDMIGEIMKPICFFPGFQDPKAAAAAEDLGC